MALASLAGRRWGLAVSGWISTFPIVAGPILFFFALEQGTLFAAEAAKETLLGGVGFGCFACAYSWVSLRQKWFVTLPAGWISFLIAEYFLVFFSIPLAPAFLIALGGLGLAQKLMPRVTAASKEAPAFHDWTDIPLRMVSTAFLVVCLTGVARQLGPAYSGALAPFPVATAVLAAFAHSRQGGVGAARLLNGSLRGMAGFCVFCGVLSMTLVPLGIFRAFTLGLMACGLAQGLVYFAAPLNMPKTLEPKG